MNNRRKPSETAGLKIPRTMEDQHREDVENRGKPGAPISKAQRRNADWEPESRLI